MLVSVFIAVHVRGRHVYGDLWRAAQVAVKMVWDEEEVPRSTLTLDMNK